MAMSSKSDEVMLATQIERPSVNGTSHRLEDTENDYELLDKGLKEMQTGWSEETLKKLKEKAAECINFSEYMAVSEDSLSKEELKEFRSLMKLKCELNAKALLLSEENSQLVMKLDKRKRQLKEIVGKRSSVMNKALKLYEAANFPGNNTNSEDNNQSIDSNESVSNKSDESIINSRCMFELKKLCIKYYKIQEIAHVLFKLVCSSRVDYVLNEDLFKIYLCCGKISNTMFHEYNLKKVNEVLDEVIVKLHDMKIEKIAAQPEEPRAPLTFEDILNDALSTKTNEMISKMLN